MTRFVAYYRLLTFTIQYIPYPLSHVVRISGAAQDSKLVLVRGCSQRREHLDREQWTDFKLKIYLNSISFIVTIDESYGSLRHEKWDAK